MGASVYEAAHTRHEISPEEFRDTLGRYASGITVISSWHDDEPVGFTCQSFYSVSLQPPLVSFSVMATSTTFPRVQASGSFLVNILAENQREISDKFARSGTDKWAGVSWTKSPNGLPRIAGAVAWIECEIAEKYPAGDHFIVLGRVLGLACGPSAAPAPLIFYNRNYRKLDDSSY